MSIRITALAMAVLFGLTGCGEPAAEAPPPVPAGPPSPPSPDLPMTAVRAREIIGDLPLPCVEMASLKMDMATCGERVNRPIDHEALRTELRDLRWTLQALTPEEARTQCSALVNEMRTQPKPQVCWDLGNG
ncbi:hypothetical protein [Phenylobacterium sp.]|uniref:hypothetical protein n=1 Tax=Phenylobacterium sp. TaxID=1871053 RepID=UPI00272F6B5E|nr:hypothetical protein [Phenylobacterium sp.]MDP1618827.1 hypothetical protein [Phenylobacterium sp.]